MPIKCTPTSRAGPFKSTMLAAAHDCIIQGLNCFDVIAESNAHLQGLALEAHDASSREVNADTVAAREAEADGVLVHRCRRRHLCENAWL